MRLAERVLSFLSSSFCFSLFSQSYGQYFGAVDHVAVLDSGQDCSGACCSAIWAGEADLVEEGLAAADLVEAGRAADLVGSAAGAQAAAGRSAVIRKRESQWVRKN